MFVLACSHETRDDLHEVTQVFSKLMTRLSKFATPGFVVAPMKPLTGLSRHCRHCLSAMDAALVTCLPNKDIRYTKRAHNRV